MNASSIEGIEESENRIEFIESSKNALAANGTQVGMVMQSQILCES